MLINLSNHPFDKWDKHQKEASSEYGECVDMEFPQIDPNADIDSILDIADNYFEKIRKISLLKEVTVHIMGEQTFCYALICRLLANGIPCVASCSERDSVPNEDGSKIIRFHFSRFRPYSCRNFS